MTAKRLRLTVLAAGLTVTLCSANRDLISNSNAAAALRFIGSRSYSIYLVHFPIFRLIRDVGVPSDVLAIGAAVSASVLVADLSFRFVETPARAMGRALSDRAAQYGDGTARRQLRG
ncbi:acyltransferase family protein [Bradyrhizobium zhanjiangense]|uniref:acyltransferase family protein n=1 Tax=Bradyrhizobium zhanjiangense TaxID=1325107 RepID=UPI0013E8AB6C